METEEVTMSGQVMPLDNDNDMDELKPPLPASPKLEKLNDESSSDSDDSSDDDIPLAKKVKKETSPDKIVSKSNADANGKRKREAPSVKKAGIPAKKAKSTAPPSKKPVAKKRDDDSSSSSSSDSSSDSDSSSSSSSSDSDSSDSDSDSSSSSSDSSSDDDVPLAKRKKIPTKVPAKKTAPKKKPTPVKKVTPKKETSSSSSSKSNGKTPKKSNGKEEKEEKDERKKKKKEDEEPEYKWWLEEPLPEGKKWRSLQHSGVLFPPLYKTHGVKMLYDGKSIELTPDQEELVTFYAQYIETDHVKKPQFNKNFFSEFLAVLNKDKKKGEKHQITDFSKCDFRPIHKYLMEQRDLKRNRTKEEKNQEKEEKAVIEEKYGWALLDGHRQKIANFRVEPPGLFLGRGNHPKAGMVKKRIWPEDVTINISEGGKAPECPIPGHKWGSVVHNDEVGWLAFWKDTITDSFKYVWLSSSSRLKGQSDMKKFETARKLKKHIKKIREVYESELKNKEMKTRQRATALYLIDHLALRVGNEKDEDEADTVGCCSLRVEHIKLRDPNIVEFDFLGKDSMRYQNSVAVDDRVFKNINKFMEGKQPSDDLFNELTTNALNSHLKSQMEGLTAKVFRTYNASITLQNELGKMPDDKDMTIDEKMLFYNRANREVAILCNHQKSVSKKHSEQMGKIDEKINELKGHKSLLDQQIRYLNGKGKAPEVPDESSDSSDDDEKDDKKNKKKKMSLPDDTEKCKDQITKINQRIAKWETKKTEKDELKTVSLTTSKINYIDPRISVAWSKKHDVPIEKIFSKTLRQKFPWAMDVDDEWEF